LIDAEDCLDIKPDNIFVKFRDRSLIESEYLAKVPIPQQDRTEERYAPVPSTSFQEYYFKDGDNLTLLEIALGDWGVSSWATQHLTERIQPVALRAPEVQIEAPWDKTVDWWNLGALHLELYRAVRMFDGRVPPDGHYELREHLAQIAYHFGPFPKELLEKGNQEIVRSIFDENGIPRGPRVRDVPLLDSEGFMQGLGEEHKKEYISFLRALMKINPAERLSTKELLEHPWVGLTMK
jgi:serine/threonine-protein kinase SRPK3